MPERVLLIEDDAGMYRVLVNAIAQLGFELCQELDGENGLRRALEENFVLVIIDGNLPRINGFDVCRKLRDKKQNLPIVMLTSRTEEIDRVLGIELGADDYISKPFSVRELAARIKGILRRSNNVIIQSTETVNANQPAGSTLHFGKLKILTDKCIVQLENKKLELTALEYKLLVLLASHPGTVFTRDEISKNILGLETERTDPSVTVMISRLRIKLEPNPTAPQFIQTVRGVGYRFTDLTT